MSVFQITLQNRTRDGYPVVVQYSQADRFEVRAEGRVPMDEDFILDLATCDDPAAYGRMLGEALFQGRIRDAFSRARAGSEDRLHVLLCVEATELRALRWERLQAPIDAATWDFLALDQRAPFSMYTPSGTDRRFRAFGQRDLRLLIVVASPLQLEAYGLDPFPALQVARRLAEAAHPLPIATLAAEADAPARLGPPTIDALCQALTEQPFTLLHIVCHGQLRSDGETVLYLADEAGHVKPISATQLIARLSRLRGDFGLPHFVFLAACESAHPQAEGALGGLGQRLVRELGMPAVVAMTSRVALDLAITLSQRFYPRLLRGGYVDVALSEANASLADHIDVLVPALYSRLGERALYVDRDGDQPLTQAQIEFGIGRLHLLISDRAPSLLRELDALVQRLRSAVRSASVPDAMRGSTDDASPGTAELDALCSEILNLSFAHIARGGAVPPYDARCPFPGLSAFQASDRSFFFGREDLVQRLTERMVVERFLALLGPSGSGKSSLLRAGVIPALQARDPSMTVQVMTPGGHPLAALHALLAQTAGDTPHNPKAPGGDVTMLLCIDQFEEIFTHCSDERERREFLDLLLTLHGQRQYFVAVAMRADYWGECAAYSEWKGAMLAHQELIGPMGAQDLRRAIEQQVSAVGLRLEDGLCAAMLAAIEDEPGAMPLLQHTLLQLWQRRRGAWLTAQAYQALGGVQLAIAETAEAVYQDSAAISGEQDRLRDLFIRLTQLDEVSTGERKPRDSRRCVRFSELVPFGIDPDLIRRMVTKLANARLVVTHANRANGEQEVEVAHEAVIRHWPRLRAWLDEGRLAIGFREGVRQAAKEWSGARCPEHLLLHRGERLRIVRELGERQQHPFNRGEQEYIDACTAAQEAERQQKEQQQQREREHAIELAAALSRALTAARIAQSRQLAMHSAVAGKFDPLLALLLAQQAVAQHPTVEALSQALHVLSGTIESAIVQGHGGAVLSCAWNPVDDLWVTTSVDQTARIWDRQGQPIAVLRGHHDAVLAAQWSPDGQQILTISSDCTARLWGRLGELVATVDGHRGALLWGGFSPRGDRILTCAADGSALLWTTTGGRVRALQGPQEALTCACYSPDGRWILTACKDGSAHLWAGTAPSNAPLNAAAAAAATGAEYEGAEGDYLRSLYGHTAAIVHACFSPDSQLILTVSRDGNACIWDTEGSVVATLRGHSDRINDGCFSPDGESVLTASRDHTVRLWTRRGQLRSVLSGHEHSVLSARFSPDGMRILSLSVDGTARLWDADGRDLATLRGHHKAIQSGLFSRDGKYILTASWDGTVRMWPGEGSCLTVLRAHRGALLRCVVSPDGTTIATVGEDRDVRLWRPDGQFVARLPPHKDQITGIGFSPDGNSLMTVARDGVTRVCSVADGSFLTLRSHADWIVDAAYSPDGKWLLVVSAEGTARLWGTDWTLQSQIDAGGGVRGICWSPHSDRFCIYSSTGGAAVWDLGGRICCLLPGHRDALTGAQFSPDARCLLTVSRDGTAVLHRVEGDARVRLQGHAGAVLGGCFDPWGQSLWTFSSDHTVRGWSIDGRPTAVLRGHRDWVLGGCTDPADRLLTYSRDGTARLWRSDGALLMELRGHRDWVVDAAFVPGGRLIVTASADRTARIWPATFDEVVDRVQHHAIRPLTAGERASYLDFA